MRETLRQALGDTPVIKQKQAGIILLILGGFLFLFIFLSQAFRAIRVQGFPELLPSQETVLYAEFPLPLDEPLKKWVEGALGYDIEHDILPWAQNRGALAFLKKPGAELLLPIIFLQVKSQQGVLAFFKNSKYTVRFFADTIGISPNKEAFNLLAQKADLAGDKTFVTLVQKVPGRYFVYIKPLEFSDESLSAISKNLPSMPLLTRSYETIGAAFEPKSGIWYGKTFAMNSGRKGIFSELIGQELPYFGHLLPVIPAEFDLLLAGQNLPKQIKKIESLVSDGTSIANLVELFGKEFLPFLEREFAFMANAEKWLVLAEIEPRKMGKNIENFRALTKKLAGDSERETREVTLPDGTKAKEFIPSLHEILSFSENFEGVSIGGFPGFYDALSKNIFLFGNDLSLLKKTIYLIQGSGFQFRESNAYKLLLQPIIKNPELAGVANGPFGQFAFSKRTFSDTMETAFSYRATN